MKRTLERWHELDDARALGDALTEDERAFLDEHEHALTDEPEQELFAEIESYGAYEPVRSDDCSRAEATLSQFNAARSRRSNVVSIRTAVVAAVAVAAAVLLWVVLPQMRDVGHESLEGPHVSTGSFVLAGDELVAGTAVPGGEWIEAAERACIDVALGRACVERATELRIVDGAIELRAGTLQVEHGEVALREDGTTRTLAGGETVTVEVEVVAAAPPRPAPQPVAVEPEAETQPPTVSAPSSPRERSTTKHRATMDKTASQMLAEARALANAGELGRAVAAYDALRRAHPQSTDAHAANVSIGLLQLRRGQSRKALQAFDRYLHRAGGLAEEARWGRVRALHALRRIAARDIAIDVLLARHPGTVYAAEAKAMRSRAP